MLHYRLNSTADLSVDAGIENYKNLVDASSYDTKTLNAITQIRVSQQANLTLNGRLSNRETTNIRGYSASEDISAYGALLSFSEKDGLRHYYQYDHLKTAGIGLTNTADRVQARVIYKISADLEVQGGVDYSVSDHDQETPFPSESKLNSGSVLGGITYRNKDIPVYETPFVLSSSYDFVLGFSDLSSGSGGVEGRGYYYINSGGFAVSSKGWQFETLGMSYNISSKRDDSPVHNDTSQQRINFGFGSPKVDEHPP